MARKIQWEPMPPIHGKVSKKNTKVIYKKFSPTGTWHTATRKARNYDEHPLTQAEKMIRGLFTIGSKLAKQYLADENIGPVLVAEFKRQRKYGTLRGFTTRTILNTFYRVPTCLDHDRTSQDIAAMAAEMDLFHVTG